MLAAHTDGRFLGFFGEPTARLRMAVDSKPEALEVLGRGTKGGAERFRRLLEGQYPELKFNWKGIRRSIDNQRGFQMTIQIQAPGSAIISGCGMMPHIVCNGCCPKHRVIETCCHILKVSGDHIR